MTKHYTYTAKQTGDTLTAAEWNNLGLDVDALVTGINNGEIGGSGSSVADTVVSVNSKGNTEITSAKHINIEPTKDFQIKAGDDVVLDAHHRDAGSLDQVLIKVVTEATGVVNNETVSDKEISAKLKINTGDITVSNKDNSDAIVVEINPNYTKAKLDYDMTSDFPENTFTNGVIYESSLISTKFAEQSFLNDVSVSTVVTDILGMGVGKNRKIRVSNSDNTTYTCYTFTKVSDANGVTNLNFEDSTGYGYLKVRAQSIDLRCEEHGGVALQPKGYDSHDNMNKIKFEHGGGDGLEFATFNTEHTSIFTNDYRFNKNGVWKMATREKEISDKYDNGDETTHYKYVKKDDDFYDVIDNSDASATTQNIIETAHAFNNANVGITPDGMVHIPPTGSFTGDVDYLLCISGLSALIPDNLCTTATVTDPDNTINFIIGQYYKTQNINDTFGITIDTNDLASKTYLKLTVVVGDAQKRYYFKKAISCSLADIVLYINYAKANNDGVFAVQSTQDTSDNTSGGVSENPDAGGIS